MLKLIETFRANPTIANARKIQAHGRKHPFSLCILSDDDIATIKQAERLLQA